MVGVREGVSVNVAVPAGVGDCAGVLEGEAVAEGLIVRVADGVALGAAVSVGAGLGEWVAVAVGARLRAETHPPPKPMANRTIATGIWSNIQRRMRSI